MPVKKGQLPKLLIRKLRVTLPTPEYVELAEVINEELIAAVSPRSGLDVTSDESNKQTVHYMLNGRISASGDNVRVFVQMLKAQTGDVAFIERWNVPSVDIGTLPKQVTEKITSVLRIHMFNHEGEDVVDRDDCDLDMQELLAKAAYHMSRIQMRDCEIARRTLSVAIEREPSHPMALAMRASTSVLLILQEGISKMPDDPAYSMELAERAVGLAPHSDFVLLTRACQRLYLNGDHEGARADLNRALKITPTFHLAHQFMAISEILSGECAAGIARLENIIELGKANNPRIPHYLTLVALGELLSRNIEAAVNAAREAHEQAPRDPWCGFVYIVAVADDHEIVQTPSFKRLIQSIALPFDHFRQLPFTKVEDVDYLEHRLHQAGYLQSA
jgi:tetratricopeptide (TPR) repeat protein